MTLFNRNFMDRSICAYYIHNFKNFQCFSSHPNSVKTFTVNPVSQLKAETLALDFIFVFHLYRLFLFPRYFQASQFHTVVSEIKQKKKSCIADNDTP